MKQKLAWLIAVVCTASAFAAVDPAQLAVARALYHDPAKSTEARQAFEKLAAVDPANADVQDYLAELALRRNDTDQAVTYAEKAVALAPDNADCQHTLGDAYGSSATTASMFSKVGLAKKCLAAYERAVVLAPGTVDFHQSLFEFYRQAPSLFGGGYDKAAAEAATIKRLDPVRGHFAFAGLYASDKKFDLALAEYDEVLKASPDDYVTLYQIGKLAATSGQFLDRGLASLRRALELPPPDNTPGHAAAQWRIGNIREKKNDPAGARIAYEAALRLDPKLTQASDSLKKLGPK
jgi:tetratricopeptide (TPR) repeat protein